MKVAELLRRIHKGNISYITIEGGIKLPVMKSVMDSLGLLQGELITGQIYMQLWLETYMEMERMETKLAMQDVTPKQFDDEGAR